MARSDAVEQAMQAFYERFSSGDPNRFGEGIATGDEALVIGTDWSQWAEGRETWISAFGAQAEQMPGLQVRAGDRLRGYEDCTTGWAADQPSLALPDGTTVPLRVTAVFRQEAGDWRILQTHLSFGVPDAKLEELLPQLLS